MNIAARLNAIAARLETKTLPQPSMGHEGVSIMSVALKPSGVPTDIKPHPDCKHLAQFGYAGIVVNADGTIARSPGENGGEGIIFGALKRLSRAESVAKRSTGLLYNCRDGIIYRVK